MFPKTIETKRLRLRGPRPDDATAIFTAYGQDPEVSRYMVWRPQTTVADAEQFIARAMSAWDSRQRFAYVLEPNTGTTKVLGMLDARVNGHTVDFGYVLARPHWGKGLMPEALAAVSELALALPTVFRLQATCDVDNQASSRILEKCGYQLEGRHERYVAHPNISPEPRACFMYARCR